ncbi:MAG TPA: hypothetical protein VJX73_00520 [Terracidiphilus sp.]|nr:hypothetical protein [Terracidiphilus sp.]
MMRNGSYTFRGKILLALLVVSATLPARAQVMNGGTPDVTHLRVTDDVILAKVTRLGVNLGEQNFYDSGQMLKNLLSRNPEFAGMTYRSIFNCESGGVGRCVDRRPGIQFPADFWSGASYEILEGTAQGHRGTVTAGAPGASGFALMLNSGGMAISAGDWIAVEKDFPGDPGVGWWPTMHGGARLELEHTDLPPGVPVHQALLIDAAGAGQSADLNAYFDSMAGRSFVHLRGRYRLSFRAKALSGSTTGSTAGASTMHVHVGRLVPGLRRYVDMDIPLTPAWAEYSEEFTANETALPAAAVETGFNVSRGSVLLSDVTLEQVGGDATNHTAFRDEVVETLKELHPGVLRLMESDAGLGSTVDNLLSNPAARERSGYRASFKPSDDVAVGIPEFLELCREIGAEPWIVAPTAMSLAETRKLAEYMAGSAKTPGGALRADAGRSKPWTQAFRTIHIELGNETWNPDFRGEAIEDPAAYGRRANTVFAAFRAAAGPQAARFDLVVGTHAYDPGRNATLLAAAPLANSLAIAPYLMRSVNEWANDDQLYGALLAQPEEMSRGGFVAEAARSAEGRQLAVYEVNLHTTAGTAPAAILSRFTPSAAAGLAVASHMLRMMRDHGVRDEMLFSLPQYEFSRPDGTPVRLWGSVVEMGADGRKRPQFLAESLANRAIRGDMVKVEISGENPTHDQPPGNDGVSLRDAHEIDAYAFQDGKWHSLIIFNYGLHPARRISVEAAGLGHDANATISRLVSSSPGDTNEETVRVRIEQEHFAGSEIILAPCSMAVLEWTE